MGSRADGWRRSRNRGSCALRACRLCVAGALVTLSSLSASAGDQAVTIVDLQPSRQAHSIHIRGGSARVGLVTLTNLNPAVNAWYVLEVRWTGDVQPRAYHLENPSPRERTLRLDAQYPSGLVIVEGATRRTCDLFSGGTPDVLEQARTSKAVFAPLCDSRLYLRNVAVGHRTGLEVATEFLRDRVWGGESVIGLGHQLLSDSNRQTGTLFVDPSTAATARAEHGGPAPALVNPAFSDRVVDVPSLGISVAGASNGRLVPGAWYATGAPGSYVSVFQPNLIAPEILSSGRTPVVLDSTEGTALCYLIAFDLDRYAIGYARGTVHPEVGWSGHMLARMKDERLPGPDGIGDTSPLVGTGLLPPGEARRTVAAFTAGFKRTHGAFLYGDLSLVNRGSHYGFIENGVVFSRLQPGLATLLVTDEGRVEMKTWEEADNARAPRIRHARQNGVPLVETDPASGVPGFGRLVTNWGAGNWSGSQDRKLRTMRSGAALHTWDGRRYLVYAVFSSATPSAMARVFQAYRCQYAMLLDMNALEHTYLAFYRAEGPSVRVEYLMTGMREVDAAVSTPAKPLFRFIGYPDNRDFFYVTKREERGAP